MYIYIGSEQRDTYLKKNMGFHWITLKLMRLSVTFLNRRLVKAEIIIWKQPVFAPLNSIKIIINNLRLKINY